MAERVWDRFLTEQDKGSLQHKEPKKIGFGQNPALLLIDLYRWVFGDKPEPLLEAINEGKSAGFEVHFQLGPIYNGGVGIQTLKIVKEF